MMYMCTCAFKHLFLHEPVLNSNSTLVSSFCLFQTFPSPFILFEFEIQLFSIQSPTYPSPIFLVLEEFLY